MRHGCVTFRIGLAVLRLGVGLITIDLLVFVVKPSLEALALIERHSLDKFPHVSGKVFVFLAHDARQKRLICPRENGVYEIFLARLLLRAQRAPRCVDLASQHLSHVVLMSQPQRIERSSERFSDEGFPPVLHLLLLLLTQAVIAVVVLLVLRCGQETNQLKVRQFLKTIGASSVGAAHNNSPERRNRGKSCTICHSVQVTSHHVIPFGTTSSS